MSELRIGDPEARVPGWGPAIPSHVAVVPGRRLALHGLLLLVTMVTTTVAGAYWQGIEPGLHPTLLARGLPFAGTLIAILLTHELGHYVACRRHGVLASLPYFLPAPPQIFPLGTFGAFIRIRSRFPHRRALFDIGAAGPWAGFAVALVATAVGLGRSTVLPASMLSTAGAHVEFGDSLLTTLLARVVLRADPSTVVYGPVAFAGWFGLFVTSINLLPAGQLDGGHVLYAAVGRRTHAIPALLLASLVWLGVMGWLGWLVWAAIVGALVVLGHPQTSDDTRPLGMARSLASAATFVVFVLTFVPDPIRIVT